jgi:uncharacterized protein YaiI (UPF0178 family)
MNVIGARPDGWWLDRDAAVRRLLGRLRRLAAASGGTITMVVDGRPLPDVPEGDHGGVAVRYAARSGRDAADDRIVELLSRADESGAVVVTSDGGLRERARALGADVIGASALLDRLDALADPPDRTGGV